MDDVTLSVHSLRPETQQQAGLPGYVLLIEGDTSRTFLLPDDGEVLVGRGDDVQIRLTDRAASRRHARLSADAGGVKLADLDSHNGTFVNGARLTGMYPVSIALDRIALNITLTSYCDSLEFGLIGCRRTLPSMQRLLDYLENGIRELEIAAGICGVPHKLW